VQAIASPPQSAAAITWNALTVRSVGSRKPPPSHRPTPIGKALPQYSPLSSGITGRAKALEHRIGAPLPLRASLADGRIPAGARLRVSVLQSPESPRGDFAAAPLQAGVL